MSHTNLTEPILIEAPNELSACFSDLNIESILNKWNELKNSFINCRLDGYIDGKNVSLEPADLNNLDALNKSFRLTNVQLFVPEIKSYCEIFEKKCGHILSVNLYYTPHSEAQCFDYHQDAQHSFAYQLLGEKNWCFLQHQEKYLKETHEQEHVLNSFKRGKLIAQEVSFRMRQGCLLEFPYGLIHRARNESNSPSAHLTFSFNVPTIGDFVIHCFEVLFQKKLSNSYLQQMQLENVKKTLMNFDGNHQSLLNSYCKKFKEDQELKKNEGRRYQ
jgi:ribosomal protein L16 Arg81 hydroxylase